MNGAMLRRLAGLDGDAGKPPKPLDLNDNPAGHNHSDYSGAVELAKRLRAYWLGRGFNIHTTVEPIQLGKHADVHAVRSNLVNGLPPADSKVLAMDEAV